MYVSPCTKIHSVSVRSLTVTGLTRDNIEEHRVVEGYRPPYVEIPVDLGGLPEDAPERERYVANRADRRRAAKDRRRG